MDAVTYLKEKKRMCETMKQCKECPLNSIKTGYICADLWKALPELSVEIVEKWSKDNPAKTRVMDFLEKFPNAPDNDGTPCACAMFLGYTQQCEESDIYCKECWNKPL